MIKRKLNRHVDTIPLTAIEEMQSWEVLRRSPYGDSFYSAEGITWGYKPHGSLRVSDHWNFGSGGEIHCRTECGHKSGWALGVYCADIGAYRIVRKFRRTKRDRAAIARREVIRQRYNRAKARRQRIASAQRSAAVSRAAETLADRRAALAAERGALGVDIEWAGELFGRAVVSGCAVTITRKAVSVSCSGVDASAATLSEAIEGWKKKSA